jgi:hypothetical protein
MTVPPVAGDGEDGKEEEEEEEFTNERDGQLPAPGEEHSAQVWENMAITHILTTVDLTPNEREVQRRAERKTELDAQDKEYGEGYKTAARELITDSDHTGELRPLFDANLIADWSRALCRKDQYLALCCQIPSTPHHLLITLSSPTTPPSTSPPRACSLLTAAACGVRIVRM